MNHFLFEKVRAPDQVPAIADRFGVDVEAEKVAGIPISGEPGAVVERELMLILAGGERDSANHQMETKILSPDRETDRIWLA